MGLLAAVSPAQILVGGRREQRAERHPSNRGRRVVAKSQNLADDLDRQRAVLLSLNYFTPLGI